MSEENNDEVPYVAPILSKAEMVGVAAAIRAMLVGSHNSFSPHGPELVMNAIAQYVLIANEEDPRRGWNLFVENLRDVYFAIAELKDHS